MHTLTPEDSAILAHAVENSAVRAVDALEVAMEVAQGNTSKSAVDLLFLKGLIDSEQHDELLATTKQSAGQNNQQSEGTVNLLSGRSAEGSSLSTDTKRTGGRLNGTPAPVPPMPASCPNPLPRETADQGGDDTARALSLGANCKTDALRTATESPDEAHRYQWQQEFARGGLGAIWQAHDQRLERPIAVKELLPKAQQVPGMLQRFVNEARITGQLDHPGVVPIYDLGFHEDGRPFYAMKLLSGSTLADSITSFHRLPRGEAGRELELRKLLSNFVDICQTVAFAHDRRVIHRDLKPANVLLGKFGEAIVLDWGLAKRLEAPDETRNLVVGSDTIYPEEMSTAADDERAQPSDSLTQHGAIMGTPSYMAPEQAWGDPTIAEPADVYALGVILYEILVGKPPFTGRDTEALIEQVRSGEFATPRAADSRVPAALEAICLRAMQHSPQNRYQSAMALADDVTRWLGGECPSVYQEPVVQRLLRWGRKHHRIVFATVASLIAITAVSTSAGIVVEGARRDEQRARFRAEHAQLAETVARRSESLAKQQALARLRESRSAADHWLIGVSGELQFYPGLETTRRSLLENAAEHYRQHLELANEQTALPDEAPLAHVRLGDVLQLLGDTNAAQNHYAAAESAFAELHQRDPDKWTWQVELTNSRLGLLQTVSAEDSASHATDVARALLLVNERLAGNSRNVELRNLAARCYIVLGRRQLHSAPEDAASLFSAAASHLRILAEENPSETFGGRLADCLIEEGRAWAAADAHPRAINAFDQAVEEVDRLLDQQTGRPDLLEKRAMCHTYIGLSNQQSGQTTRAQHAYEASIADYGRTVEQLFAVPFCSENLAVAEINLANVLLQQDEAQRAAVLLESAADELSQLIHYQGQTRRLLTRFADCQQQLAEAHSHAGNAAAARSSLEKAEVLFVHLRDSYPDDTTYKASLDQIRQRRLETQDSE